MDGAHGTAGNWILAGLTFLLFRTISRVEALEKTIQELVEELKVRKGGPKVGS
jgi:hypothetical protein